MQEFTYEQIREKALRQGVKDNRVHIGLWANINNYLKTRKEKEKWKGYYIIISHCRNWLINLLMLELI